MLKGIESNLPREAKGSLDTTTVLFCPLTLAEQDVSDRPQTPFEITGISMKYRCQSCNYELPDLWKWKVVDRSKYLMVVTCPHCNNEFIRMEYDPDTPYGYKVVPSMIFIPQGVGNRVKGNR